LTDIAHKVKFATVYTSSGWSGVDNTVPATPAALAAIY